VLTLHLKPFKLEKTKLHEKHVRLMPACLVAVPSAALSKDTYAYGQDASVCLV
jgi:hypothetical protein